MSDKDTVSAPTRYDATQKILPEEEKEGSINWLRLAEAIAILTVFLLVAFIWGTHPCWHIASLIRNKLDLFSLLIIALAFIFVCLVFMKGEDDG